MQEIEKASVFFFFCYQLMFNFRISDVKVFVRQRDLADHFSVVCGDGTRGNGHMIEHKKFRTNMRKNLFMVRVTENETG